MGEQNSPSLIKHSISLGFFNDLVSEGIFVNFREIREMVKRTNEIINKMVSPNLAINTPPSVHPINSKVWSEVAKNVLARTRTLFSIILGTIAFLIGFVAA